jgi:enamine deaminase RidA (YjgF/YER057c/UK114 family)
MSKDFIWEVVLLVAVTAIVLHKRSNKDIKRYDVDKRFTDACKYNGLVFISGQVGVGSTIKEQTDRALADVDAALKKAGTDKTKILELTIWLADMKVSIFPPSHYDFV